MSIADNVQRVRERIASACARAQRSPDQITLVAISKQHPPQAIWRAMAAGVQHFGENRVEEAELKIPAVHAQAAQAPVWHMVGHVQSRKAKLIPPLFSVVHSVDSLKVAQRLAQRALELGTVLDILLEVNVSGEASKYGIAAQGWERDAQVRDHVLQLTRDISALEGLRLRGLMTMAPIVDHMEAARPVFASLAALRDTLSQALRIALPDLSMGMTDDYPIAIEEGATLVRVGRAIFGERP